MTAESAMYWVVVLVMTSHVARTTGQLDSPHLPWRTTLERRADFEDSQANLCRLPPYPERGGYVVVDAPGAGPGDVHQNVSLVQYTEDIYGYLYLKLLRCSSGRWSEYVFEYNSEKLYFNVSWCPVLCPPGDGAPPPTTTMKADETFEEISPYLCKLPPNPDRGFYDISYTKTRRPGKLEVNQYVLDEANGVYEVFNLVCKNGQWVIKFWKKPKSETLRFDKDELCPVLCATTVLKVDSEPAKQPYLPNIRVTEENTKNQTKCELPPYPQDGNYTVMHRPAAAPGAVLGAAHLSYSCYPNRKLVGSKDVYCIEGAWSDDAPKCIHNTTAVTQSVLSFFAECGSIRSIAVEQTSSDTAARRELPWHVALYDKQRTYERICSGSIVATNLVGELVEMDVKFDDRADQRDRVQVLVNETVRLLCNEELEFVNATVFVGITLDNRLQWGPHITAHCFGSGAGDSQPTSRFVVAAGKARGAWSDAADEHAQTSDAAEVIIHPRYRGKETSYQNNIALIFLDTPLNYTDYVMSVCLDFDLELDEKQLADGNLGKIASWGSASKNGTDISKLKVDWTPYVDTNKCISNSSPSLLQYITSDKICAGDAKSKRWRANKKKKGSDMVWGGGIALQPRESSLGSLFLIFVCKLPTVLNTQVSNFM
ncbi:Coagulation factor IX [Eumeta japonica]|uniref:Coagulation factor IX n=1 Tax=Eumeta variegata TaxID=151549 RepID=A0A4C1UX55_EUMVA|nr:Coagulation factor IX [Eumeta japonica]